MISGRNVSFLIAAGLIILYFGSGFLMGLTSALVEEYSGGTQRLPELLTVMAGFTAAVTALLMVPVNRWVLGYITRRHKCQSDLFLIREKSLENKIKMLQEEYRSKEKASKAKSKFMNRMSHDLRTPLNAITGYSMLLDQARDDSEKVGYYAQKINVASHLLLDLINDVLDMSCIESGNVRILNGEFSIASALEEIKASIRPQAEAKNQQLNAYVTNLSNKDKVVGDKRRFCQVVRNLLSNAVKYTEEGGVVDMMVNIIETGNEELQVVCQIKDDGCGMSKEFIKKMFHPFEREDSKMNESVQGTGLGMSIAKSFVELMKGRISVDSRRADGTLVTVNVPLTVAPEDRFSVAEVFEEQETVKGMRFLAAEDNESNAEILENILTAMGAECVIKGNGQDLVEAFEASEPGEFDMILMDIQMPIMDGYQATTALRRCKHPNARDIVVLAMTADAFEEDVQRAFVSGMNGHVAKPLDIHTFLSTVESLKNR